MTDNEDRKRTGDWTQSFTGIAFYALDMRIEEIDARDIAHSLALQCRFAGHCVVPYSVAEHSVRVSRLVRKLVPDCPRWLALAATLHDSPETWLLDVVRPMKIRPEFAYYRETEKRTERLVEQWAGLEPYALEHEAIKRADNILLVTEARDLMRNPEWRIKERAQPLPEKIVPWSWQEAEQTFLAELIALQGDRGLVRPVADYRELPGGL